MAFKLPSWRWLTAAARSRTSWLCSPSGLLTRPAPFWAGGRGGGSDGGSCCCGCGGGGCVCGSVCCKCVTCSVGNITLRKNESSRKHARSVAVLSRTMRARRKRSLEGKRAVSARAHQGTRRAGVGSPDALRARTAAQPVQGLRRLRHLRARAGAQPVQGLRRWQHLRAWAAAQPVQGLRRRPDLRARAAAHPVQGLRRRRTLRARAAARMV